MDRFFGKSIKYEYSWDINISNDYQPPSSAYGKLETPECQIIFDQMIPEKIQSEVLGLEINIEESIKYENSSQESSIVPSNGQNMEVELIPLLPADAAQKFCKCRGTNCTKGGCNCHKNNRRCSDKCRCKQCNNHRFKKDTFIRFYFGDGELSPLKPKKKKPISK